MRLLALQAVKSIACDVLREDLMRRRKSPENKEKGWGDYQAWAELYHVLHTLPKDGIIYQKDLEI